MTRNEPDQSEAMAKRRELPFVKKYREFWVAEQAAAWLYRSLAELADEEGAATLRELAEAEDRHAAYWASLLERSGIRDLEFRRPPWRERFLAWVARRFGLEKVLPTLVKLEAADARKYVGIAEAPTSMGEEEVQHGRALALIGRGAPSRIADVEDRHRVRSGGALRAATFGVNDGLVSNFALVMGVAGGTQNASIILLAGIAGLVAGAISMGAGEWVSVRSQTELYEREIEIEREELRAFPEEEAGELALIYQAKGIERKSAQELAARIMERPEAALDTLAREELGLDPEDLASPWVAALASFAAFAIGALIPVIPYLFLEGRVALLLAAGLAGAALVIVGVAISVLTGRGAFVSAFRMLLIGAAAATITFGIGKLTGAAVS